MLNRCLSALAVADLSILNLNMQRMLRIRVDGGLLGHGQSQSHRLSRLFPACPSDLKSPPSKGPHPWPIGRPRWTRLCHAHMPILPMRGRFLTTSEPSTASRGRLCCALLGQSTAEELPMLCCHESCGGNGDCKKRRSGSGETAAISSARMSHGPGAPCGAPCGDAEES